MKGSNRNSSKPIMSFTLRESITTKKNTKDINKTLKLETCDLHAVNLTKKTRYVDKIEAMLMLQKPKIAIDQRENFVSRNGSARKKAALKDFTYKG